MSVVKIYIIIQEMTLHSSTHSTLLHPPGASIPICTCPPGYIGNGYGPNGCTSNICQTNNPCVNGQCVVSVCDCVYVQYVCSDIVGCCLAIMSWMLSLTLSVITHFKDKAGNILYFQHNSTKSPKTTIN